MSKQTRSTIQVRGTSVGIVIENGQDYICLTDIARHRNPDGIDDLIRNWLRNRNTVEFLGVWERLHNPGFNPVEFDGIRIQAGLNSFTLTPKQWIEKTSAVGITSKPGRYGGTYAHQDIAFEFASWMQLPQGERLQKLNAIAIRQMRTLTASASRLLSPTEKKAR